MADVFLSYKKEDVILAERIAAGLRHEGITVWWDEGLTPKESWDATIEREISLAGTVIVLWSPRSVVADWVRREAHFAQDRGKLIPIIVEATTIPIAFTLNQTLNLVGWDGSPNNKQWRKLLTWIADLTLTKPGNANIPKNLTATASNRFRGAVGHLVSGESIVDGALVNASTPNGTVFRDGDHLPVMRIVPRGSFLLGSSPDDPDRAIWETPQKHIEISLPFAIGVFPVLISEYSRASGVPPPPPPTPPLPATRGWSWEKPGPPLMQPSQDLPVTDVSYDEAQSFVNRLISLSGESYRIPSEAEWEWACRAGSRTRYSHGDFIDSKQAAFGLSVGPVRPGSFPANSFGLYDMHGNVREWTADMWHESYDSTPSDGRPAIEGHGSMRVIRGGGWSDTPAMLRSAARMRGTQSVRSKIIGFRVARSLK